MFQEKVVVITGGAAGVGCGKCEQHCPQHLPIREKLKEASKELESPLYRVARAIIKPFTKI